MSSSPAYLDPVVLPLIVGDTVLDVACGLGRWGNLIRTNFWEAGLVAPPKVDGFDAFAPNVEFCNRLGSYRKVWQHLLPQPIEGKWDTVLACEIIEHLSQSDVETAFSLFEGAARQRVIISTPNWPYLRGGGETIVGYNKYEAHLSYISRGQFKRRGYKIFGAGFGNPKNPFTRAVWKWNPSWGGSLQSISRKFPSLGTLIVATKDI